MILSIIYSTDADFLPVTLGRIIFMRLVDAVEKCYGRLKFKCLVTCMKGKLNPTRLKLRMYRLIMNRRKLFLRVTMKPMLRGDIIIFVCVLCLAKCRTVLKKRKKRLLESYQNYDELLSCLCLRINSGWFQMLWQHSKPYMEKI